MSENNILKEGKLNLEINKETTKKENKGLDGLVIYGKYLDLISYTEMILKKYPKQERFALASFIKNKTYEGMEYIIYAYKIYDKNKKMEAFNMIDTKLKMLKVLIRISYKNKYISLQNYHAWSYKLAHIGNLLGGWINSCRKQ